MNIEEFNKVYNGGKKCYVRYRDSKGYISEGLICDHATKSLAGYWIVPVDSIGRSVKLDDVIDVEVTNLTWI